MKPVGMQAKIQPLRLGTKKQKENDMGVIGLIDVDSHNFPNLALMKLSAFHKSKGDQVEMWSGCSYGERK